MILVVGTVISQVNKTDLSDEWPKTRGILRPLHRHNPLFAAPPERDYRSQMGNKAPRVLSNLQHSAGAPLSGGPRLPTTWALHPTKKIEGP